MTGRWLPLETARSWLEASAAPKRASALPACARHCSSSGRVMSLMVGAALAAITTAVPRLSSSLASGSMPSITSEPAAVTRQAQHNAPDG